MSEDTRERLMREAADIFLKLREDPENPGLQARRDAFCARGGAERAAYDDLLKTWKASGVMRAPRTLRAGALILLGGLGLALLGHEPLRLWMLADLRSDARPESTLLASGDRMVLDAESAVQDRTDQTTRQVALLTGAAFFDVETDGRPFRVEIGGVTATVVGTAFETAFVDETVLVSVTEGRVNVRLDGQTWELGAGDQFSWSEAEGAALSARALTDIATWRQDRLSVDGMTLGQAAAIIERRLSGPVIFTSEALKAVRVTGNLDLSQPLAALRILAETGGGQVYDVAGLGRIIAKR